MAEVSTSILTTQLSELTSIVNNYVIGRAQQAQQCNTRLDSGIGIPTVRWNLGFVGDP